MDLMPKMRLSIYTETPDHQLVLDCKRCMRWGVKVGYYVVVCIIVNECYFGIVLCDVIYIIFSMIWDSSYIDNLWN